MERGRGADCRGSTNAAPESTPLPSDLTSRPWERNFSRNMKRFSPAQPSWGLRSRQENRNACLHEIFAVSSWKPPRSRPPGMKLARALISDPGKGVRGLPRAGTSRGFSSLAPSHSRCPSRPPSHHAGPLAAHRMDERPRQPHRVLPRTSHQPRRREADSSGHPCAVTADPSARCLNASGRFLIRCELRQARVSPKRRSMIASTLAHDDETFNA